MRRCLLAVLLSLAAVTPLWAAAAPSDPGPMGRWDREDGLGGIEIKSCGDTLCGRITWLRDAATPAHVGQEVLFDMRRTDLATWSGSANNPEDGRTYAGTMTLDGARLVTRGCLLGGFLCQSVALIRPH